MTKYSDRDLVAAFLHARAPSLCPVRVAPGGGSLQRRRPIPRALRAKLASVALFASA